MTDTTRRSLALRSPEGSSSQRPSVTGYIEFQSIAGRYLHATRPVLSGVTRLRFIVKVKLDTLGQVHYLCGWNNTVARTQMSVTSGNFLNVSVQGVGPVNIGGANSTATVPASITTQPVWLSGDVTISTGLCTYQYSLDSTPDASKVSWLALGTAVVGANPGATVLYTGSDDLLVGAAIPSTAGVEGFVYAFREEKVGVGPTAWFSDTDIPGPTAPGFWASGGGLYWELSAGTSPAIFLPSQTYHGALRADFAFTEVNTGLAENELLGVVAASHTVVRVSYKPSMVPPHTTLGVYQEAMVVRSTAGFPATNLDGSMVIRHLANDPVLASGYGSVLDTGLIGRQWYYYALFVRYDVTSGWFKVAEVAWLNPGQYGYPERFWQNFPNYYRRIDQGIWISPGYLRRICNVVGYEFDLLRTWSATVGDVWDFEKLSAKLLPEAGAALGLIQESANGDRRLRTLVGNLMALRKKKGTKDGVEGYVSALTGWPSRAYEGLNLLHRQQHAEWLYSFTATDGTTAANADNHPGWTSKVGVTTFGQLSRQIAAANEGSPIGMADGSFYLRMTNTVGGSSQMDITYGNMTTNGVHPLIPVIGGHNYKFSAAIKSSASATVRLSMEWYDQYAALTSTVHTFASTTTTWQRAISPSLAAPSNACYARMRLQVIAGMPNNAYINLWRPMFVDLAWRPEGIPTLANNVPLSSAVAGDVGTFVHQNYYEAPREVKINVYPMRTNLALNSDFLLNNQPPNVWITHDAPTYGQIPVAYTNYTDIIDAEVGDSEADYADLAGGLAPLIGSVPTITYDTAGTGRLRLVKSTSPYAFTIMHNYFEATDLGGMSAAVGAYSTVAPTTDPPYLVPTTGTVTTPDPGVLPQDGVFVFRVRGPSADGSIVSQMPGSPNNSWEVRRSFAAPDRMAFIRSATGTATLNTETISAVTPTSTDEFIAFAWDYDPANLSRRITVSTSPDGQDWTALPPQDWASGAIFDSGGVVRIGGTTASTNLFNGRIYWVELRDGTDPLGGTLQWRFDASDYPGSGTSYVDPRGRTWTLTTAPAIARPSAGTRMTLAFEWYTDNDAAARILDANGGVVRTSSLSYVLTTTESRYELINAQPPPNAVYGRMIVSCSNTVPFEVSLAWALIEDAPYPEQYFNGDFTDGDDGDFFYAIGKGYTGAAHLSPSVYYQQFRHFASGVAGSDSLSQLMPYLLPFRRSFKVVTASTGLYNEVT